MQAATVLLQPEYGLDEANLWNHSLAVATAAKFLTEEKMGYEKVAFTAGLLHDVGKIVFTQIFSGEYQNIVKENNRNE
jgi:putative nucleotidyltransferase with HDIG domain